MQKRSSAAIIDQVLSGSLAEEVGLVPGDRIQRINGRILDDLIDYHLIEDSERFSLEVIGVDGRLRKIEVDNREYQGLGVVFTSAVFDGVRTCQNNCLFCFVDQMPAGMRPSLYLKDDDYRLSFLQGSYITLTNLSAGDWERISRYRLSPLYLSIHATDPKARERLFGTIKAREIMGKLQKLAAQGINLHAQAVICPGINDGDVLERTISDLGGLWPSLQSLAVVPVGLTRHRLGLPKLRQFTPDEARAVLDTIRRAQTGFLKDYGSRLVFAADEFILRAGAKFPPLEEYEDLWQLENGVGLWPLFKEEFIEELRQAEARPGAESAGDFLVVTGAGSARLWEELRARLAMTFPEIDLEIMAVANSFFGPMVTVTGLVTGEDITRTFKAQKVKPGRTVLIPEVMLAYGKEVFLDGMSLGELQKGLGFPVRVVANSGKEAVRALLGLKGERQ